MRVVNTVLLSVLAGIIGLVLSGFTAWHLYLVFNGQTTIESLEKTRYLSPLKKSMEQQIRRGRQYVGSEAESQDQDEPLLNQLKEIHANALPGVTRPEEGEDGNDDTASLSNGSPAQQSLRRTYADIEEQRERDRYANYLDEQDSEKMPHAFNLGWRRNLQHVFGPSPMLWPLPVCNTSGDGWNWAVSENWISKRDEIARSRTVREQQAERSWQDGSSNGFGMPGRPTSNGAGRHYQDQPLIAQARSRTDVRGPPQAVPMRTFDKRRVESANDGEDYETSSDEEDDTRAAYSARDAPRCTENWNDVPDDVLSSRRAGHRSTSRARRKGD